MIMLVTDNFNEVELEVIVYIRSVVLAIQSARTQSQLVPSQLVPTVNSYPSQVVPKVNSYPNAKKTQSNVIIILVIITA